MPQSKVLLAETTQKIVSRKNRNSVSFEKVERYKFWWTIEITLNNLKKNQFYALTFSSFAWRTTNAQRDSKWKGSLSRRGSRIESNVYPFTCRNSTDIMMHLTSVWRIFSLVLRKVMSGVGRERGRGFLKYNLQSFFISHYVWHLHKCT